MARWDETLLKVEIKAIEALNFDIGKMGLDMEFMTKLFDEGGVNIAADRDEAATGLRGPIDASRGAPCHASQQPVSMISS
jgi:hypothetical protein